MNCQYIKRGYKINDKKNEGMKDLKKVVAAVKEENNRNVMVVVAVKGKE